MASVCLCRVYERKEIRPLEGLVGTRMMFGSLLGSMFNLAPLTRLLH